MMGLSNHLTTVSLNCAMEGKDFTALAQLKRLFELQVWLTNSYVVCQEDLAAIGQLPHLLIFLLQTRRPARDSSLSPFQSTVRALALPCAPDILTTAPPMPRLSYLALHGPRQGMQHLLVPALLPALTMLRGLTLDHVCLGGHVNSLGALSQLTRLYICSSHVYADTRRMFSGLISLQSLKVRNSIIDLQSGVLQQLSSLTGLTLTEQRLGRSMPFESNFDMSGLPASLAALDLTANHLVRLPYGLTQLTNLTSLNAVNQRDAAASSQHAAVLNRGDCSGLQLDAGLVELVVMPWLKLLSVQQAIPHMWSHDSIRICLAAEAAIQAAGSSIKFRFLW